MYSILPPKKIPTVYKPLLANKYGHTTLQQFRERYGNTISYLYNPKNGTNIILVGTAHISRASANQVLDVMRTFKPSKVMVELDKPRALTLLYLVANKKHFYGYSTLGLLYSFFSLIGRTPGMEFYNAILASPDTSTIVLGDYSERISMQDFILQLKRALSESDSTELDKAYMSMRTQLLTALRNWKTFSKREFANTAISIFKKVFPRGYEMKIVKRDDNMARVLYGLTGNVVAVVGLAHMDGIEQKFQSLKESAVPVEDREI